MKTYLFYSGFIRYHNNYDVVFDDSYIRKYTFGIVASDLSRNIKNIEYSINVLNNYVLHNDVIVIGKNNDKYKDYNFTFIENIEHENMLDYYKNIKYIIQDSFYESCSNVKIEAFMNGSKLINSFYVKKLQILKPIEKKIYYLYLTIKMKMNTKMKK